MPNKGNAAANELLEKLFAARALAAYKGLYTQSALRKRTPEVYGSELGGIYSSSAIIKYNPHKSLRCS